MPGGIKSDEAKSKIAVRKAWPQKQINSNHAIRETPYKEE
jgi:hypothetical protein